MNQEEETQYILAIWQKVIDENIPQSVHGMRVMLKRAVAELPTEPTLVYVIDKFSEILSNNPDTQYDDLFVHATVKSFYVRLMQADDIPVKTKLCIADSYINNIETIAFKYSHIKENPVTWEINDFLKKERESLQPSTPEYSYWMHSSDKLHKLYDLLVEAGIVEETGETIRLFSVPNKPQTKNVLWKAG